MPTAGEIEITDAELGTTLKKGVSLDKYVAVRRQFRVSPTRARVIASLDGLSIESYADASALGLTYSQIVGMTRVGFGMKAIIDFMYGGRVSLDEAIEAFEAGAPLSGSYSYVALRFGQQKVSHHEIIDKVTIATNAGVTMMQRFLEFSYGIQLSDTQAIEATSCDINPVSYMYAIVSLDMLHEDIMEACTSYSATQEFERQLKRDSEQQHEIMMVQLRQQLAIAGR